MMRQVDDRNFEEVVVERSKQGKSVLLFATAEGCGQSKTILDIAPKMEEDYRDKIEFVTATIEELNGEIKCPRIKDDCKIRRFPTLVLFQNGEQITSQISEKIPMQQLLDIKEICGMTFDVKK